MERGIRTFLLKTYCGRFVIATWFGPDLPQCEPISILEERPTLMVRPAPNTLRTINSVIIRSSKNWMVYTIYSILAEKLRKGHVGAFYYVPKNVAQIWQITRWQNRTTDV